MASITQRQPNSDDLTTIDTTKRFAVGVEVESADGKDKWIYVKNGSSVTLTVGKLCVWYAATGFARGFVGPANQANVTISGDTTGVALGNTIAGMVLSAIPTGKFGWIKTKGDVVFYAIAIPTNRVLAPGCAIFAEMVSGLPLDDSNAVITKCCVFSGDGSVVNSPVSAASPPVQLNNLGRSPQIGVYDGITATIGTTQVVADKTIRLTLGR